MKSLKILLLSGFALLNAGTAWQLAAAPEGCDDCRLQIKNINTIESPVFRTQCVGRCSDSEPCTVQTFAGEVTVIACLCNDIGIKDQKCISTLERPAHGSWRITCVKGDEPCGCRNDCKKASDKEPPVIAPEVWTWACSCPDAG